MPGITRGQDTLVCDNGGFEDDIVYYSGFISHFKAGSGSSTCDPKINGTPVVFTSANMQQVNRFQISALGTDPLTNEPRVKFGEYSFL
ncbi:MAG: hypothetical protein HOP11_05500 [Saprospiraceae bacterium]|nr:hypothetical protein [Saprospiraceae bacterium]